MPGQRSVWGIDLGQCALKAIKLSYDAKADHAVAEAFDYIEHAKILSQPEADPDELIKSALDKFLSRNSLTDSAVFISVAGQSGLARFVKLPPVETKKIPDIVRFEAKQQIPFPLEEVVWDYQRIGAGEVEEGFALDTEVGIFAIKKDMAHRHMTPFVQAGIEVDVVQLAPLALYNFLAFDHFYHGTKAAEAKAAEAGESAEKAEEEAGDTVVLLDIGADKTDVVITDGDSIWLRNLPIGGNHFTRILTKEMKLTFAKAEHLKRNATKAADPKKLYQSMRPVFQDFVSELQRSIQYFSSTHRNRVIKQVLGVGNGFKLPGLQKFLQQNLNYDVQRVEKFCGLGGEENIDARAFSENQLSFCVAYGLALQGLQQTPIQTNLLPTEIRTARMIRAKKPWSLTAAACLLFGFVATFIGNYRLLYAVSSDSLKQQSDNAENRSKEFAKWKSEFDASKGKLDQTRKSGEQLVVLEENEDRLGWIKVFGIINKALPPRREQSREVELEKLEEINVEYIRAAYLPDAKTWFDDPIVQAAANVTMAEEDKKAPPSGPCWVFQVLGYTFHEDYEIYVRDRLIRRFQTEAMRNDGISHAVVFWVSTDESWTPATGSPLEKRPTIVEAAKKWGAGGAVGQGAMMAGGVDNGMAGAMGGGGMGMATDEYMAGSSAMASGMGSMMMQMQQQQMPSDFQNYQQMSMGGMRGRMGGMRQGMGNEMPDLPGMEMSEVGGPQQPLTLMRTDFEFHLIWQSAKKPQDKPAAK